MKFTLVLILTIILIAGCSSTPQKTGDISKHPETKPPVVESKPEIETPVAVTPEMEPEVIEPEIEERKDPLIGAEEKATPNGRKVLETGRQMTLVNGDIIRGGCWDYANAVYNRAGFSNRKRQVIYKARKSGPYADVSLIQPGDWIYHVNHSYGGIEHSAIFVDWIDYEDKIGLMLSYAGERRREPARYLSYDLSSVYRIVRAGK